MFCVAFVVLHKKPIGSGKHLNQFYPRCWLMQTVVLLYGSINLPIKLRIRKKLFQCHVPCCFGVEKLKWLPQGSFWFLIFSHRYWLEHTHLSYVSVCLQRELKKQIMFWFLCVIWFSEKLDYLIPVRIWMDSPLFRLLGAGAHTLFLLGICLVAENIVKPKEFFKVYYLLIFILDSKEINILS